LWTARLCTAGRLVLVGMWTVMWHSEKMTMDSRANLDGDVVPMRQTLLHVESDVNGNLNEEGNCQPANHGIPPKQALTVRQQDPHWQSVWYHVPCNHVRHAFSTPASHWVTFLVWMQTCPGVYSGVEILE